MTNKLLLLVMAATIATSCKKQPTACAKADKAEYIAGETIKLTSCSEDADHYLWTFPAGSTPATSTAADIDYTVDPTNGDESLTFKLETFSKKDKKKDETTVTVTVKAATGKVTFWQDGTPPYNITTVTLNSTTAQITDDKPTGISGCDQTGCANFTLKVGSYSYTATETSPGTATWSGTVNITKDGCLNMQLD